MPILNNKTIQYDVYGKINAVLKKIASTSNCTLPSIEMLTDTIKGSGIMGEIDFPSYCQPGAMTFGVGFRVDTPDAATLSAPGVHEFELRWATDKFDSGNISIGFDSHKAIIKGACKKYDPGKVETGAAQDGSNEYEVFYYKKFLNGKAIIEIDKLNNVYKINGIDYAASLRAAL